jgi:hypothetical protein
MSESESNAAIRLVLVYSAKPETPLVIEDEKGSDRIVTSGIFPLHALTRTGREERPEWTRLKAEYPIPIDECFVDDLPGFICQQIAQRTKKPVQAPCIIVRKKENRHVVLLSEKDLSECRGDLTQFRRKIEDALGSRGLKFLKQAPPTSIFPKPKRLA